MIWYVAVIAASNLLLSALGIVCTQYPWWWVVLTLVASTVAVIALDGLTAFLVRRFPERWFSLPRCFGGHRWECRLYRRLGIRKWKEQIPELGCFTSFSKSRVERPSDGEYLARYIMECNYGVAIHGVNAAVGFLLLALCPLRPMWLFALPVALINGSLSLLPLFVLRYNLPKLQYLHERTQRKAEKTQILDDCY